MRPACPTHHFLFDSIREQIIEIRNLQLCGKHILGFKFWQFQNAKFLNFNIGDELQPAVFLERKVLVTNTQRAEWTVRDIDVELLDCNAMRTCG